jgi:hypothetical protein
VLITLSRQVIDRECASNHKVVFAKPLDVEKLTSEIRPQRLDNALQRSANVDCVLARLISHSLRRDRSHRDVDSGKVKIHVGLRKRT